MTIHLIHHRDPYSPNPRGGELSVRAIVEYLRGKGHTVVLKANPEWGDSRPDLALTWGRPAEQTARFYRRQGVPVVLMVRFWKNVCPLPAGNLMEREVDKAFTESKRHLFETAAAIITNTDYARQVIERWQPVSRGKVHVSYVPILGEYDPIPEPGECVTVITPEVYGEDWLVNGLAQLMPEQKFLVVNAKPQYFTARYENIEVRGYMDQDEIWNRTRVLLVPVYGNDICGTRRVTIESMRRGVPVLASDACGMDELVNPMMLTHYNAGILNWNRALIAMKAEYGLFRDLSHGCWLRYNTPAQLEKFERILLECVK